jgi:mRNA interferase RelE/StbE
MRTLFNPHFVRDLRKTKDKALLTRVESVIEEIEGADTLADIRHVKKLVGYDHAYRIRVGNYRIGIYCETDVVELARSLHRRDIYRSFP